MHFPGNVVQLIKPPFVTFDRLESQHLQALEYLEHVFYTLRHEVIRQVGI